MDAMMTCATGPAKQCRVCGDVALSFNFCGLCCESCKAFFRRNAIEDKVFKCGNGGGICQIDKYNRKFCKKCRLQKCYQIGMIKEKILRYKSKATEIKNAHYCDVTRNKIARQTNTNFENDCKVNNLPRDSFILQTYDQQRLHDVCQAMKVFENNETHLKVIQQAQTLIQVLILLKNSYPEVAAVYIAFLYDAHQDGFNALANETGDNAIFVKMDFSSQMTNKGIASKFRRFVIMMNSHMENDPTIRDLIIAQLLFNQRKNVSCPEFIKYNHSVYMHLFLRYLKHKYKDFSLADSKFSSIMFIIDQIAMWSGTMIEVYRNEIDHTQLPNVLTEIYNQN